jgi:hypothetical protein
VADSADPSLSRPDRDDADAPMTADPPEEYEPPLDPGIKPYVILLREHGVETYESCQGGEGHAFPEPTVRFSGERPEGFRALAVALQHDLPVANLRRTWSIQDGEPTGPHWEMTFWKTATRDTGTLDREVRFYRSHLDDLLGPGDANEGRYVVIKGEDIAGVRDTFDEALSLGYGRFGLGPFLVKKIERIETVHHI